MASLFTKRETLIVAALPWIMARLLQLTGAWLHFLLRRRQIDIGNTSLDNGWTIAVNWKMVSLFIESETVILASLPLMTQCT